MFPANCTGGGSPRPRSTAPGPNGIFNRESIRLSFPLDLEAPSSHAPLREHLSCEVMASAAPTEATLGKCGPGRGKRAVCACCTPSSQKQEQEKGCPAMGSWMIHHGFHLALVRKTRPPQACGKRLRASWETALWLARAASTRVRGRTADLVPHLVARPVQPNFWVGTHQGANSIHSNGNPSQTPFFHLGPATLPSSFMCITCITSPRTLALSAAKS